MIATVIGPFSATFRIDSGSYSVTCPIQFSTGRIGICFLKRMMIYPNLARDPIGWKLHVSETVEGLNLFEAEKLIEPSTS